MELRVKLMVNIFLKQQLHKAKSSSAKTYAESTLFTILSAQQLLPEVEKTHYLNKLQEIVCLPEDYFKVIYEELIDNFAVFVQTLPESYGEELGGLLTDGFRRGLLAIQILTNTAETKPHPLYVFAIFSIALLSDLGQILNYRIMISDEKGGFIDEWVPCLGPMTEFGEYFKLRPYEGTPIALISAVTPLLARQLLSETAITWLSSNNQIFDMWLAFLNKGEDWSGGLGKVLKVERKDFENKKVEIGLVPTDIPRTEPMGTDLAEKFLAWIKSGLLDGTISFNEVDSNVHVIKTNEVDASVFLQAPELFQQFINTYPKTRDWVVVCKQFNYLGITQLSGQDVKFQQFFADSPEGKSGKLGFLSKEKNDQKRLTANEKSVLPSRVITAENSIKEGVVVKDAKMLFGKKVPAVSQFLRDIEMRWSNDSGLPKIRSSSEATPGPDVNPKSSR
jgi:hypothetical protein